MITVAFLFFLPFKVLGGGNDRQNKKEDLVYSGSFNSVAKIFKNPEAQRQALKMIGVFWEGIWEDPRPSHGFQKNPVYGIRIFIYPAGNGLRVKYKPFRAGRGEFPEEDRGIKNCTSFEIDGKACLAFESGSRVYEMFLGEEENILIFRIAGSYFEGDAPLSRRK